MQVMVAKKTSGSMECRHRELVAVYGLRAGICTEEADEDVVGG